MEILRIKNTARGQKHYAQQVCSIFFDPRGFAQEARDRKKSPLLALRGKRVNGRHRVSDLKPDPVSPKRQIRRITLARN